MVFTYFETVTKDRERVLGTFRVIIHVGTLYSTFFFTRYFFLSLQAFRVEFFLIYPIWLKGPAKKRLAMFDCSSNLVHNGAHVIFWRSTAIERATRDAATTVLSRYSWVFNSAKKCVEQIPKHKIKLMQPFEKNALRLIVLLLFSNLYLSV